MVNPIGLSLPSFFLPIAVGLGVRPATYSQISAEHRDFIDKLAKARGYQHYKDAGRFHPDARKAFNDMVAAAKGEKITLAAFSTYRPYDQQVQYYFSDRPTDHGAIRKIWQPEAEDLAEIKRQYLARAEMVAPPGYSKHHTGLAVDLKSDKESYWESDTGKKTFQWLVKNAPRFGYQLSYSGAQGT